MVLHIYTSDIVVINRLRVEIMLSKVARSFSSGLSRSNRGFATKAAVCGAAGGIGQPLSLLLKLDPNIDELSLLDVVPFTPGVAVDISHVNSKCQVSGGFTDKAAALKGCDIVVVPAGVPRKPGMTRDDLFNVNASINYDLAAACAAACPNAFFSDYFQSC